MKVIGLALALAATAFAADPVKIDLYSESY